MKLRTLLLGGLLTLGTHSAFAQAPATINLFGTVEKIDATTLVVKADDGKLETFKFAPKLLVTRNKPATLADIRPSDFVASAAERKQDGKLHSTELRIFPEALRGQGEGQRPMNDPRNQTMTNATVTGTAIVNGSNKITVKLETGESELMLDPGVPVTRIEVVEKTELKAGAKVRVQGARETDSAVASRITLQ